MSSGDDADLVIGALFGLGAGLYIFYRGFRELKLEREIAGLSTSNVRSAAVGTVELSGRAAAITPLEDPIFKTSCVFYNITVQEQRGSGKHSHWVTIYHDNSFNIPFFLADDTGRIPIVPYGAQVYFEYDINAYTGLGSGIFSDIPDTVRDFIKALPGRRTNNHHIYAQIVREDEPLYVLGYAVPSNSPLTFTEKVKFSLKEAARRLKANPERMKALDTNKDGVVDAREWDEGLSQFTQELQSKVSRPEAAAPSLIVRKNPDGFFVLGDKPEKDLLRQLHKLSWLKIIGGPVLFIISAVYLCWRLKPCLDYFFR